MQNRIFKKYAVVLSFILSTAQAEIITDGSLGAKVTLSGSEMQITPDLGQQLGSNLFHSFQDFNLSAGEIATFSGANSIQNIIARVTGGHPSMIDGTLRSTIPNADLYFL
ncbi:MAG: filamentous hemagglutinin N-terminal domain-containing protein, partial [Thiotrichaceae bacterium]